MDKRVLLYLGNIEKSFRHVHDAMECYLVIRGQLEIEVEDDSILLSADDLLVINRNQVHLVRGNTKNLVLCLRIEREYLEQECRELLYQKIVCNSVRESEGDKRIYNECKRLLTRMLLIHTEKKKGYELEFKAVFYLFLSYLVSCFTIQEEWEGKSELLANSTPLEEVLLYIKRYYNRDISLDDMASLVHLSPPYFSKFFKQKIGIGFIDYITKIRLEHTRQPLLQTEHSILKIAMDNGFANQKSFSEKFKKEYGENPSEYRKKFQNPCGGVEQENIRDTFDIHMEEGLIPFLKYIHQHDTEDIRKTSNAYHYRLDLKKCIPGDMKKIPFMIDIEHITNMQNPKTIEQLEMAAKSMNISYIYCKAFTEEREYSYIRRDSFDFYEIYEIVRRIKNFDFLPFIQIDFSAIIKREGTQENYAGFLKYIDDVFQFLTMRFTSAYIKKWKIELCYSNFEHEDSFFKFYQSVQRILYQYVEDGGVGVLALKNLSQKNKDWFAKFLSYGVDQDITPGFYSFHAFPEEDLTHAFRNNYQDVNGYYNNLVEEIIRISERAGRGTDQIYMTEWNTLAGKSQAESGTFFRSSLIVDGIRRVSPSVKGMGLHLDTYEVSREKEHTDTSVLALFLYNKIKRPVFFIAEAISKLGSKGLLQDERVQVTKNEEGEYAILMGQPSYVNPSNSIDPAFVQKNNTEIELELSSLEPGRYRVKTFIMDQKGSGVFNRWEQAGFPDFMDPDVVQYLEGAVIPELRVEEINVEHSYLIKERITFNGVILKIMQPI